MKRTKLTIEIPGIPVTANHAVGHTRNGRGYKTPKYANWVNRVNRAKLGKIKYSDWYRFDIELYFSIYNKSHKVPDRSLFETVRDFYLTCQARIKRKDTSNYIKYAEDVIFQRLKTYEGIKLDDKQIIQGSYKKIDSEEEKTKIIIHCVS